VKRRGKSPPVVVVTQSAVRITGCKAKYIPIMHLKLHSEVARFATGLHPDVGRGRLQGPKQQCFGKINDKGLFEKGVQNPAYKPAIFFKNSL